MLPEPELADRVAPVRLTRGKSLRHEIQVVLPEPMILGLEPADVTTPHFEFHRRAHYNHPLFTLTYDLRTLSNEVPLAELESYLQEVDKVTGSVDYELTERHCRSRPARRRRSLGPSKRSEERPATARRGGPSAGCVSRSPCSACRGE